MHEKTKVVLIIGHGRSGTTLLDRLISEGSDGFSAGEVHRFWDWGVKRKWKCACGKIFTKCEVWNSILARSLKHDQDLNEIHHVWQKVARPQNIYKFLFGDFINNKNLEEYRSFLNRFYKSILEYSGKTFVVDSSVSPIHAFILAGIDEIDLTIIHIVRDARAVAYSNQRDKKNPGARQHIDMKKKNAFSTSFTWNVYNFLSSLVGKKTRRYYQIRYEDIACKPMQEMIKLANHISINYMPQKLFITEHKVHFNPNHMGSGNPMRFKTGKIDIKLDDEWKNKLSFPSKILVSTITLPGLIMYDYIN